MRTLAVIALLLAPTVVCAVPAFKRWDSGPQPKPNRTTSMVMRDDADPKRLWVLPPNMGRIDTTEGRSLSVDKATCDSVKALVDSQVDLIKARNDVLTRRRNALESLSLDDDKYDIKLKRIDDKYNLQAAAVETDKARVSDDEKRYRTRQGGFVHLTFKTDWQSNVDLIRSDNPDFSVEPVQTKHAQFKLNIPLEQDKAPLGTFPLVISDSYTENAGAMANAFSADYSITEAGACYFKFPRLFSGFDDPVFGLVATYDYDESFAFKVTATYNMWVTYLFAHSQGSSGGLFDSKSWSKTTEETSGNTGFTIKIEQEAVADAMDAQETLRVAGTIRQALIADILMQAHALAAKGADAAIDPGAPPADGAKVISQDLMNSPCSANAYCAGAAIALRGLDAIFGSSSSSTELQKQLNQKSTFDIEASRPWTLHGVVSFASK